MNRNYEMLTKFVNIVLENQANAEISAKVILVYQALLASSFVTMICVLYELMM